jgi:Ankyrin repeats (3 copies)
MSLDFLLFFILCSAIVFEYCGGRCVCKFCIHLLPIHIFRYTLLDVPANIMRSLAGLKRLGALHVLYEYLHDWRKALPSDFKALDKDDLCQRLEKSIELANWAVETAFRDTLTRLVESAQESFALQQELVLRRALKAVERFENVAKRPGLVDGAQKIHSKILRHLIAIAQAQDDIVEVTHFQGELSILDSLDQGHRDTDLNETLAQSLQNSARLACDVLWDLNMPPEVRNTLAFTRQTTLRTAHRAMHAGFEEVAKSLSSNRSEADSLLPEVLKRSLVHMAVETGSLKLLPYLIKQNPGLLNSHDALNRTPLLIAAAKGDLAAYDILVKAGAFIQVRDRASRSVLNHACASGSFKMVQKLLKGGANINDDVFGVSSPLFEAASRGHYEICLLLLEHGDCANHLTKAAELAEKNGHHNVAALLQQNTALYSKSGLSLLREGLSSRSTPSYTYPDQLFDDLSPQQAPQWDMGATFEMSCESSHSSSSEPMFDPSF